MPLPLDRPGDGEERVLRQLVSAVIFEGIGEATVFEGTGHVRIGNSLTLRFEGWRGPFGRPRILGGTIKALDDGNVWVRPTLHAVVSALPGDAAAKDRLYDELKATAAALAMLPRQKDRRGLSFAALDRAIDEGHPYHPSFKARSGFSAADQRTFAPEYGHAFQLMWLAVPRRHLIQMLPSGEADFLAATSGPELAERLFEVAALQGLDASTHGFLPVHPWQWAALARTSEDRARLGACGITALGYFGNRYAASQSVRTLTNVDHGERASVKCAMDMTNSSVRRTLDPFFALAAPALSDWLARLIDGDRLFAERYRLAAAVEFASAVAARDDARLAGRLVTIWRESVESMLEPGEAAVPMNALMALEDDGDAFIRPWVERHGLSVWVDRFIEVAVMPVWHLLVAHGVATEAHGQNMILVHRNGWPERLILRDFHDSIEYVEDFLPSFQDLPDFQAIDPEFTDKAANRFYWMDDIEELRALVGDALFIYNLSDISLLIERQFGFGERQFWTMVASRLNRYAVEHGLQQRQARLKHDRALIGTEPLLRGKLGLSRPGDLRATANALSADRLPSYEDWNDQDRRHAS